MPRFKKLKRDNSDVTKLVNRVKRKNDKEAFNALVKIFEEFIHHTSYKFFIKGSDVTDIIQECYIALRYKAIPDYNKNKGDFISFGRMCIKRHIITQLKSGNKKKNTALNTALSLTSVTDSEDENMPLVTVLKNKIDTPFGKISKTETKKILFKKLEEELTELEKRVFHLFCQRFTYSDIARKLRAEGVEKANEKLVDNAIARMKKKAIDIYKWYLNDI